MGWGEVAQEALVPSSPLKPAPQVQMRPLRASRALKKRLATTCFTGPTASSSVPAPALE